MASMSLWLSARMEADGRLIEDVDDAEGCAELGRETDALAFNRPRA